MPMMASLRATLTHPPPYLPAPGPLLLSRPLFGQQKEIALNTLVPLPPCPWASVAIPPAIRATEGNRTQHTCVLVPFLLFLLSYC